MTAIDKLYIIWHILGMENKLQQDIKKLHNAIIRVQDINVLLELISEHEYLCYMLKATAKND